MRTLTDLCYRYNKYSKECLLRNAFLCFTFVCFSILQLQSLASGGDETHSVFTTNKQQLQVLKELLQLIQVVYKEGREKVVQCETDKKL